VHILPHIALAISSSLYTGFLPGWLLRKPGKAGGTAGALCALLIQWLLLDVNWILMLDLIAGSFLVGCVVTRPAEQLMLKMWGPRQRHNGEVVTCDFNETNIDEVHGQLLAGFPLWLFDISPDIRPWLLILSFVLFRIFDTIQPDPIDKIERATRGTFYGVMIDDTAAGLIVALWCIAPITYLLHLIHS
jgi:phosphatidylglycerophosphatase A